MDGLNHESNMKMDKKQDDHTLFCVPEFKFTENHTKVFEQNFYT